MPPTRPSAAADITAASRPLDIPSADLKGSALQQKLLSAQALPISTLKERSVKQIRKRITYANVMSSIAVFLVLGGGAAYAAKKIGSNEIKGNSITTGKIKKEAVSASKIKKNAVTTAKIANGAVTGAKLNLGTVGTVPNAAHANTADNANNANTVGGQSVTKIFTKLADGASTTTIANIAGFTITAACPDAGSHDVEIVLHGPGGVGSDLTATLGSGQATGGDTEYDSGLNPEIFLDNGLYGDTPFTGSTTSGKVISGNIGFDYPNTFNNEDICVVYGDVFSG
jgi:hypothetical protein